MTFISQQASRAQIKQYFNPLSPLLLSTQLFRQTLMLIAVPRERTLFIAFTSVWALQRAECASLFSVPSKHSCSSRSQCSVREMKVPRTKRFGKYIKSEIRSDHIKILVLSISSHCVVKKENMRCNRMGHKLRCPPILFLRRTTHSHTHTHTLIHAHEVGSYMFATGIAQFAEQKQFHISCKVSGLRKSIFRGGEINIHTYSRMCREILALQMCRGSIF